MGNMYLLYTMLHWCAITLCFLAIINAQHHRSAEFENYSQDGHDTRHLLSVLNGKYIVVDDSSYLLASILPYTDLFSPNHYTFSTVANDNAKDTAIATEILTGRSFVVPVYRKVYSDDTVIQVLYDIDNYSVSYAEVRGHGVFKSLLPTSNEINGFSSVVELEETYTSLDYVDDYHIYHQEDILPPEPLPTNFTTNTDDTIYHRNSNGVLSSCNGNFQVVNIAIVYDAEFCAKYGSRTAAESRIMAIIMSASLYYEQDMCVKLQLTRIWSPDNVGNRNRCPSLPSATFDSFKRDQPCSSRNSLLNDFSTWLAPQRDKLGFDKASLVHYFTGYTPPSTIGCAYRGTLCWNSWSYGVEYITFSNDILVQGTVFAHENGHSLNATHASSADKQHVMESALTIASDGFSDASVQVIKQFLNTRLPECSSQSATVYSPSSPKATKNPTKSPTNGPNFLVYTIIGRITDDSDSAAYALVPELESNKVVVGASLQNILNKLSNPPDQLTAVEPTDEDKAANRLSDMLWTSSTLTYSKSFTVSVKLLDNNEK